MNWEMVSAVAAGISALTAGIGLPLIWFQLRDVRDSQFSQAIAFVYERFVELDKFFVDHPDLRSIVYSKADPDGLDSYAKPHLEAVAEYVTDVMYQAYNQRDSL